VHSATPRAMTPIRSPPRTAISSASSKGAPKRPHSLAPGVPSGLRGKLVALEDYINRQHEEIVEQKREIEELKGSKDNTEHIYQAQLSDLRKTYISDFQKLQDEHKRTVAQLKGELARLHMSMTQLKADKATLQQQVLVLQRRQNDIEEQIGSE
jgi:hypothetical protein